ncbi:predicted protein [Naegleria gruberi]|uniref:Predicted protein n=1 Tax=Naegleria gruberi TaxID=5762 RepID=D2VVS4_NAEGR|nr:uncharacterized protein NAEGRDRAFT_59360 [Naegleria gruberi]EFC39090.1 predicted protein [Naegleria gruberi]|eukprot:XP_002671834.1 predicted protein [Naegleria gruberi strain NEG-M]
MNNQQPPPFLNSSQYQQQQQQYSNNTTGSGVVGGYSNVPHPLDPLSSQRMTTSFSASPLPPLPQGHHHINHQHYQSFNQPSPTLSGGMNTSGYLSTTGGMPHSHSSSSIASATSSVGVGQPPEYMMRSGTVFTAGPGIGSSISLSQQHEAVRAFLKGNDFPIRTPKKVQDIKGTSLEECVELAKSESWKEFLKKREKQIQKDQPLSEQTVVISSLLMAIL